jgi:hypothetical protein
MSLTYAASSGGHPRFFESGYAIDRDDLLVPETLIESLELPSERAHEAAT